MRVYNGKLRQTESSVFQFGVFFGKDHKFMGRLIKIGMLIIIFLLPQVASVRGEDLLISPVQAVSGEEIDIPLMLDKTENLAGLKLSLAYDANFLIFKKAERSPQTSSLMHIVNDKNPGLLIIVMAGARGIKGENIPLMTLKFQVNNSEEKKILTAFKVKEIQLMSDKLKALDATVHFSPVEIMPANKKIKSEADKK